MGWCGGCDAGGAPKEGKEEAGERAGGACGGRERVREVWWSKVVAVLVVVEGGYRWWSRWW